MHLDAAPPPGPGTGRRWARLGLCVLLVLGFVFYAGPWLARTSFYREAARAVEERGIDAGSYFYTDVEAFSEAHNHMRNVRNFAPDPTRP